MTNEFGDAATFSAWMRGQVLGLMTCPTCGQRRYTLTTICEAIGIPRGTLHRFLAGGGLRVDTADRVIAFLRSNKIEWPGGKP